MMKINFNNIRIGMILANDVLNRKDMVLLQSGSQITDKDIRIFKMWGINEIEIQESEEVISNKIFEQYDSKIISEVEEEVKQLFFNTDLNHPVINELYQYCIIQKVEQKS